MPGKDRFQKQALGLLMAILATNFVIAGAAFDFFAEQRSLAAEARAKAEFFREAERVKSEIFYAEQGASLALIERELPQLRAMFNWWNRNKDKGWLVVAHDMAIEELNRILEETKSETNKR